MSLFKPQNSLPSDTPPLICSHLLILSKKFHQLGTAFASLWFYGRLSSFKSLQKLWSFRTEITTFKDFLSFKLCLRNHLLFWRTWPLCATRCFSFADFNVLSLFCVFSFNIWHMKLCSLYVSLVLCIIVIPTWAFSYIL